MECIGTLETICRYPVKSMAGEEVDEAFICFGGMMGDRAYAFVRSPGLKGFPWHTGRDQEDMVLYQPRFRHREAATMPVEISASLKMAPGVNPVFPAQSAFEVEVTTPEGQTYPVQSKELAAELGSRSKQPLSLRFSERSHYDCRPISLFGNASALALGEKIGMPIDRRRFRANFYADWVDARPYREDELVGRVLQIGERLQISVLERDPRCKMITLDPDTAKIDRRVLEGVTSFRQGFAGVYAAVLVEGVVRRGDPIQLF